MKDDKTALNALSVASESVSGYRTPSEASLVPAFVLYVKTNDGVHCLRMKACHGMPASLPYRKHAMRSAHGEVITSLGIDPDNVQDNSFEVVVRLPDAVKRFKTLFEAINATNEEYVKRVVGRLKNEIDEYNKAMAEPPRSVEDR